MSKQYLTTHMIEDAHPSDIFSLAATPTHILSCSGSSTLKVYSTIAADFPLVQTLVGVHKLGCHHLATSKNGKKAASVGFGGETKIWRLSAVTVSDGETGKGDPSERWVEDGIVVDGNKAGEIWALALSEDGQYLASTTYDGRINVWDTSGEREKIREYHTKGSFGMSIDLSVDGRFTASGHESGGLYIFNNDSGRLLHSLPGLIKPVRTVAFSPASKLLAAAGDATIIGLYDVRSGEQVFNLTGHSAWIFSVDWSHTGEYLLSGSFDGKVKVWSLETRSCVATHAETDQAIWTVRWLPPYRGSINSGAEGGLAAGVSSAGRPRGEGFAVAGAHRRISFYREASGG